MKKVFMSVAVVAMMIAVVTWAQTGDKKNEEKVTRLKNKLEAKIDYYNKNVSTMSPRAHELCLQGIGDLIESIRKYEPNFMRSTDDPDFVKPSDDPAFVKPTDKIFTVQGVSFKMIKVEGGTFQMGATSEQGGDVFNDEKPVHSVTLSDYHIGQTEVTQALWQAVMGGKVPKGQYVM